MVDTVSPSKWIATAPGVRRRTIAVGDKLFQMLVEFQAGATTPTHSHPHEQVIHVIRGKLRLTLPDQVVDVTAGESFVLRSNVPHGAEAPVATLVLDSFTPLREDLMVRDAANEDALAD